jgi:mRNA-degrading endonuclease toxin of MazEF toxin-antitoxin module
MPSPRRGEIWCAGLGDPPVRHWVVVISVDARNLSKRVDSVLVVPFGSAGFEGPTILRLEPGESGLPGPSYLKGHFITTLTKKRLLRQEGRQLSARRMRQVCELVAHSIDPDASYGAGGD